MATRQEEFKALAETYAVLTQRLWELDKQETALRNERSTTVAARDVAIKGMGGFVGQNHRIHAVTLESGIVIVRHNDTPNVPVSIDLVKEDA